jgi:hypothetical protein
MDTIDQLKLSLISNLPIWNEFEKIRAMSGHLYKISFKEYYKFVGMSYLIKDDHFAIIFGLLDDEIFYGMIPTVKISGKMAHTSSMKNDTNIIIRRYFADESAECVTAATQGLFAVCQIICQIAGLVKPMEVF